MTELKVNPCRLESVTPLSLAIKCPSMLAKILLQEPMFADLSVKLRLEQTLGPSLNYLHCDLPGAFSG